MSEQIYKKALAFKKSVRKVFSTVDGMKVLAYLKDNYVDSTALGVNTNETMYKLGQKELIQGLITLIKSDDILDEVIIRERQSEEY